MPAPRARATAKRIAAETNDARKSCLMPHTAIHGIESTQSAIAKAVRSEPRS